MSHWQRGETFINARQVEIEVVWSCGSLIAPIPSVHYLYAVYNKRSALRSVGMGLASDD